MKEDHPETPDREHHTRDDDSVRTTAEWIKLLRLAQDPQCSLKTLIAHGIMLLGRRLDRLNSSRDGER